VKKGSSQKIPEDDHKYGYEYIYTVIAVLIALGLGLAMIAMMALSAFLLGWLPIS
jgi:divalent metal cation (Fe/Co/Zn/Cd) transporter